MAPADSKRAQIRSTSERLFAPIAVASNREMICGESRRPDARTASAMAPEWGTAELNTADSTQRSESLLASFPRRMPALGLFHSPRLSAS